MKDFLNLILSEESIQTIIRDSEDRVLLSQFNAITLDLTDVQERIRLAFLFLNAIYSEERLNLEINDLLSNTYSILKSININSTEDKSAFESIIGVKDLRPETLYYFLLSSIALKADKSISIRLDLTSFNLSTLDANVNWKIKVLNKTLEAFILLVRKSNGFDDIRESIAIIHDLQKSQERFEKQYLDKIDIRDEVNEALELLGFYHLSKTIVETATYLIEGYSYKERLENVIRTHIEAAIKFFVSEPRYQSVATILKENLILIQKNSIWSKTNFNDTVKRLCKLKSDNGMIDLLPSQRDALGSNLLDVASNVTVLQMPTSAGKTLLAEFNILVTKALKQDAKIVYIVPSRALVNQVFFDLKNDLGGLGLTVEKTSSAIEIDPGENTLLEDNIDILVSTPEKLDLLIRRNHSSVADVSLFIVDEAHTIQNGQRGAKLELLLSILKRERPFAKFMLLSPFIGSSATVLGEWLGGGNSISIDWRPSEKLIIGLKPSRGRLSQGMFDYTILPSPYSSHTREFSFEVINNHDLISTASQTKNRIFEYTAKQFSEKNKTILFLCRGKGTADARADLLYDILPNEEPNEELELVIKYIIDEVGRETVLSKVLSKRIAVHHAGLSDESKILVEYLIRKGLIKYVCSTTTVAEGVNFPVSTVFFDSYRKGDDPIDENDFWNIAGRAGRTLVDNYGKIILPFTSPTNINTARSLLNRSSYELVSVLSELFSNADIILDKLQRANFSLGNLLNDFGDSLFPLIQYFVHLITVSGNENYAVQIEDLFKDTLEYHILDTKEKKDKFINICRELYNHIEIRYAKSKNVLSFADKTGFSVPSVISVMSEKSKSSSISNIKSWEPNELFNSANINNLTEKVRVIAALRETRMGSDSNQAPFEPAHIANILVGWVKGAKFDALSKIHPTYSNVQDPNKRINEFITKMNDIRFKASWGLSALEGIVKGNQEDINDSFIPSLVYYGVDNEQALALRMVGLPRPLAFSMAQIIDQNIKTYSFSQIRTKISSLTTEEWNTMKPRNSSLSGSEWRKISKILIT